MGWLQGLTRGWRCRVTILCDQPGVRIRLRRTGLPSMPPNIEAKEQHMVTHAVLGVACAVMTDQTCNCNWCAHIHGVASCVLIISMSSTVHWCNE